MNQTVLVYDPVAPPYDEPQLRPTLDALAGKVVGFIDNAKPNFDHLVDDLAELLVKKYGVSSIVKHRKRGQVPVEEQALSNLAQECDAVITGSGD